ncbi:hypothetical protein Moror_13516 [Moniliophthora roreri MCA 2997]|uniref:KOW domain-containing protein n=1 Tax=Moniliophthora roreri (strain MCA 2997) TaxID=1381753 RepID=V2WAK1_MONRO|nr:hypothetical protein Moror_13516 [Moniliophthora roreri MCA 2997]
MSIAGPSSIKAVLGKEKSSVLQYLDVEAMVESNDEWESEHKEDDDYFIDDAGPQIEDEAKFLEDMVKKWQGKLPRPSLMNDNHDCNEIQHPEHSVLARFSGLNSSNDLIPSSSSQGTRTPFRGGKHSRLTGNPVPLARDLPSKAPPHIFGKVNWKKKKQHAVHSLASLKPFIPCAGPLRQQLLASWSTWASRRHGISKDAAPLCLLSTGEWVLIHWGRYKEDVGLVWKTKTAKSGEKGYLVWLVPWLDHNQQLNPIVHLVPQVQMWDSDNKKEKDAEMELLAHSMWVGKGTQAQKRKLKTQPPPNLFNPDHHPCTEVTAVGTNADRFKDPKFQYVIPSNFTNIQWNQKDDYTFVFQGNTFVFGLLVKFFSEQVLYLANSMSAELYFLFSICCHPIVWWFPVPQPDSWHFEVGDYVVCDQPNMPVYLYGWFVEMSNDRHCIIDLGYGEEEHLRVVLAQYLKKVFEPGDYVKVVSGPHQGREGLILEKLNSFIGVLEVHGHSTQVDFFVHVNSVQQTKQSFTQVDIPWRNVHVLILKQGRYKNMNGVVKDILQSRSHVALFVSVYISDLDCTEKFRYPEVMELESKKPLLVFQPLTESQKPWFALYWDIYNCSSGVVPWIGTWVHIVKRHHKKLQVVTLGQMNPHIKVDYAHICEIVTGKPLESYRPLYADQVFFSLILNLFSSMNVISWKKALNPIDSKCSSTPPPTEMVSDPEWMVTNKDMEEEMIKEDAWGRLGYTDAEGWFEEICTEILVGSRDLNLSTPSSSALSISMQTSVPPSHWILHSKLQGIPIYVEINGGEHNTLQWNDGVSVVPDIDVHSNPIVRSFGDKKVKEIEPNRIAWYRKRPNPSTDVGLLVVVGGEDEHIGKFAR